MDGETRYVAMWTLGNDGRIPNGEPLYVATPKLPAYTPSLYSTVKGVFSVFEYSGDPSLENMQVYYSTDGGATWSTTPLSLQNRQKTGIIDFYGETCTVYTYETEELKDLGAAVTNLKFMPYGETGGSLRTLQNGDRSSQVRALQYRLRSLGFYHGWPDGIFGAATQRAVDAARAAFSLPPTGIVDWALYQAIGLTVFE